MSLATHCIPWDEDCTICNPPPRQNPDDAHPTPDSQITPKLDTTIEQLTELLDEMLYQLKMGNSLEVEYYRSAVIEKCRQLVEEARKEGEQNMVRRARAGALL